MLSSHALASFLTLMQKSLRYSGCKTASSLLTVWESAYAVDDPGFFLGQRPLWTENMLDETWTGLYCRLNHIFWLCKISEERKASCN